MVTTMDDALDLLRQAGPDLRGGNSNHGPMVAEALCALGRHDAVLPWLESYRRRCQAPLSPRDPIVPGEWHTALGDRSRSADWVAFFDRVLTATSWQDTLQTWVPRLVPGLMAAATHGLIRTGHATRTLSSGETPQRRHELAEGLGYWAACYQQMPGQPSGRDAGHTPGTALHRIVRVHGPDFQATGSITGQIQGLDTQPAFAGAIDLVDTTGDLSAFLSELTEACAGIYLANPQGLIAFVHAVTAPSALRLIAPYLSADDARLAARYAWQASAGIYAWYATVPLPATTDYAPPPVTIDSVIDRAITAAGAHTIKFTEACLREYALNPAPVYLAAAYDAADRVGAV